MEKGDTGLGGEMFLPNSLHLGLALNNQMLEVLYHKHSL